MIFDLLYAFLLSFIAPVHDGRWSFKRERSLNVRMKAVEVKEEMAQTEVRRLRKVRNIGLEH